MADLALGAVRSVVEGTLTRVQSAIETEANLRQSAQSDLAFITEEFQMMRSFLGGVDEGRAKNKVVGTWVGQVRELAYDVEDGMEFVAHLDTKPDWWRRWLLPCMARPLDEAVAELKQLKARVEDVSNRNTRYNIISESGFKPITQQQLVSSAVIGATSLDMLTEVRSNEKFQQDLGNLTQLITNGGNDALPEIWVCGTGDDLSFMSIIRKVYQTPDICQLFPYRGWFKMTHPFNPHEVLRSLMVQFYKNSCLQNQAATVDVYVDELAKMEEAAMTQVGLIKEFMKQTKEKRYLVVLENVTTMGQWDAISTYLPDINNGSLVILCTQQREIANMCVADSYQALEMKHYSACVLFKEGPQGTEGEVNDRCGRKSFNRIPTYKPDEDDTSMERFTPVGRESQMDQLHSYLVKTQFCDHKVISVWGIPGVGKSTLVRHCYYRLIGENKLFQNYSWVNVSHPFNLRDFCQSILSGLHSESFHSESFRNRRVEDPIQMCRMLLKEDRCLVVIDDLLSNEEWDLIQPAFVSRDSRNAIIVITNDASIATHCAGDEEFVINVTCLEPEAASVLFANVVRQMNPESVLIKNGTHVDDVADLISKCGGIPKVIVAIADVLAPQTFTALSSTTNLSNRFMPELEGNPDLFGSVRGIFHWMDSFIRTRPDFLKQCLLYLAIFPRQHIIRRRRLVRRWIAEGYCKDTESSSEERGEWSFSKLVELSMIQKPPHSAMSMIQQPPQSAIDVLNYRRMIFCQVNNFVGEYIFSRPMEGKLVLQLKDRCSLTTQSTGRHLVIQESWKRDIIIFESIDFARLRSLTVFGKWESYLISERMKVLRVLDLEDASGVTDKDLQKLVTLLPRLKFLSLRGCTDIHHLPSSLGVLKQLETLDVRETSIITIPVTITKLKKLQYLRAGTAMLTKERSTACCSSRLFEFKRCKRRVDGVKVARGIEKLTALHTLGVINVSDAGGKAILKTLEKLTQLRKLGVSGINKKNIKEFCSAISCHDHLESLSVRLSKGNQDCLNNISLPPGNLQSFKLFGFVKGLPTWIGCLPKLAKLDLEITISEEVAGIIQVLREIEKLSILRLCVTVKLPQDGDGKLDFINEVNGLQRRSFENLKILEIACTSSNLLHVYFRSDTMINLELLTARCCSGSRFKFPDLKTCLRGLKEVRLVDFHDEELKKDIENQLKEHRNKLSLKSVKEPRSSHRHLAVYSASSDSTL